MTSVLNLALNRIDKEEKQKLILKLMSEIWLTIRETLVSRIVNTKQERLY
jgi:hypothetical protein